MKIEISTEHSFTISLYLLQKDIEELISVVSSKAKNNHMKLDNGLNLWFYCNSHDINNPKYSIAIFNKGRKVYYGGYKYSLLIRDLQSALAEYKAYYSTHYTGR